MESKQTSKLLQDYLKSMPTSTPDIQLMQSLTLKKIRPSSITQAALSKELDCSKKTIFNWEKGEGLDGITSSQILKMAMLFERDVREVLAAIENTRQITKKEN